MSDISIAGPNIGYQRQAANDRTFVKEIDAKNEDINEKDLIIAKFASSYNNIHLTQCTVGSSTISGEVNDVVMSYHGNNILKECTIRGNIVSRNGQTELENSRINKGIIIGASAKISHTRWDNPVQPSILEFHLEHIINKFHAAEDMETLPELAVIADKTIAISANSQVNGDVIIRGAPEHEQCEKEEKGIDVFDSVISGSLIALDGDCALKNSSADAVYTVRGETKIVSSTVSMAYGGEKGTFIYGNSVIEHHVEMSGENNIITSSTVEKVILKGKGLFIEKESLVKEIYISEEANKTSDDKVEIYLSGNSTIESIITNNQKCILIKDDSSYYEVNSMLNSISSNGLEIASFPENKKSLPALLN